MSRCKICPICGEKNDPRSMECSCGTDLTGIPAIDPEILVSQPVFEGTPSRDTNEELVRICTCGAVNPAQARKCFQCDEDISDILPEAKKENNSIHYQLAAIGSDYLYEIPCGTMIVGREHGMKEALASKSYVSRIQAKLSVEAGKLYIENLSSTNYTYVNNIRIPSGRTQLNIGDEVAFGGITINGQKQGNAAYFIVGKMQ